MSNNVQTVTVSPAFTTLRIGATISQGGYKIGTVTQDYPTGTDTFTMQLLNTVDQATGVALTAVATPTTFVKPSQGLWLSCDHT